MKKLDQASESSAAIRWDIAKKSVPPEVEIFPTTCPMGCEPNDIAVLRGNDRLYHIAGEFHVVRCMTCGLMRTDPVPTPGTISYYYPGHYEPFGMKDCVSHAKHSPRRHTARGYLLEVGCASGQYLERMRNQGWDVLGVEPFKAAAEVARKKKLQVINHPIESVELDPNSFDRIACWMTLEHTYKPLHTLEKLYRWMKPGGVLELSVPDSGGWEFRMFGADWYALQVPTHITHFTKSTLKMMLQKAGWEVVAMRSERNISNIPSSLAIMGINRGWPSWLTGLLGAYSRSRYIQMGFSPLAVLLASMGLVGRLRVTVRKNDACECPD